MQYTTTQSAYRSLREIHDSHATPAELARKRVVTGERLL